MSRNHLTSIVAVSHRPSLRQQLLRQLGHARINRASPTTATAQPRSRANQRAQVSTTPAADKPQSKVEHERLHRTVRALLQIRQTDGQTDSNRIDGSGLVWQLWQLATVI